MVSEGFSRRSREGLLSAISAGFFLVLVGFIFIMTPNLYDKIISFFQDLTLVNVGNLPNNIMFPQPLIVGQHVAVYTAVEQFSLVWGVFLVAMLAIRFLVNSSVRRRAQNLSDIVFWFGTAYLVQTWLIGQSRWFEFWALILMLLGISLVVRAVFLAAASATRK